MNLYWLNLPKNLQSEKWPVLVKTHGLTPLENFDFVGVLKSFFLSRISKNVLFRLDLPKKLSEKNDHFLPKCMDYPLWKIFIFLDLFKTWLFSCRNDFFLFRISKNVLSSLDLAKNHHWEKWLFLAKNHGLTPLENFLFLGLF